MFTLKQRILTLEQNFFTRSYVKCCHEFVKKYPNDQSPKQVVNFSFGVEVLQNRLSDKCTEESQSPYYVNSRNSREILKLICFDSAPPLPS